MAQREIVPEAVPPDGRSYRYGLVNLGGCDQRDIADQFRECQRLLPFVFR